MEPNQKKANGLALIPFAVFVGVYLATGITLNAMGVEMAFYQLPTPIASFIGIIVAFPIVTVSGCEVVGCSVVVVSTLQ